MMRPRLLDVGVLLAVLTWTGCVTQPPGDESLRQSFAEQVAGVSFVRNFQRTGDDLTFSGPYAGETDAKWRVHIDSAVVEPQEDAQKPYKGTIKSSWYVNGQRVEPRGSYSDLPSEFLDRGIGQECWAFWEKSTTEWSWV
jgi:hypothetical protein